MTNLVMLVHGRYRLTMQAVDSIRQNTKRGDYTLTIVYDWDSDFRVRNYLVGQADRNPKDTTLIQVHNSRHCLGALKNLGVKHSASTFGRGQSLVILDNDICVFPGWFSVLGGETQPSDTDAPVILGGVRHPFHQVNKDHGDWVETDAVAGYCHAMDWDCWDEYGPYDESAPGIGQSEDWALCQRAREGTANVLPDPVGYANPPVMAHTGITNSKGEPIAGADLIERVPGVLYL